MKPLVALALAFVCAGCMAEPTDSRPVVVESGNGLLVVDWSIDGAQDPPSIFRRARFTDAALGRCEIAPPNTSPRRS
jgi:hypothetical protein